MNITEDYVSFEVAKLLKEKGFNEKCRYIWKLDKAIDPQDTDGISKVCAEQFMQGESFVDNSDIKKVVEYEDWFEDYHKAYLCPTLQMAMKWLREVHKINLHLVPFYEFNREYTDNCKWIYGIDSENKGISLNYPKFNSYEEACEAAIKYCLTNLI